MAIRREYCIYIMTNTHHTVSYAGVTNNLQRRVFEPKNGTGGTFTRKYNLHKLVYYEVGEDIRSAIAKENQIKGGSRQKKKNPVSSANPERKDLSDELCAKIR